MLWLPAALALLASPALGPLDARGCGRVMLEGEAATPAELCVREVRTVTLEGEPMVVARVALPRDPRRAGVFVYRREGGRLVPRFLGSGFQSLEVDALLPSHEELRLAAHGADGPLTLRCTFRGFPLECTR